jgi:glycosyltransferase involved in cell wall biosynthesis
LETATVVVFDLIDLLCPDSDLTPRSVEAGWRAMQRVQLAHSVVTISKYSRERIISICALDPSRVFVVPFGVDSERFQPSDTLQRAACREALGLPKTSLVVLYVGSEQRRKNLETLVAGLADLRRTEPDLVFIKVGRSQSNSGRSRFQGALRTNGMESTTKLIEDVPEAGLTQLYRAADVFAFPSIEEGWGVSVLEAMACGLPVVSSRIPPVVEFAGDSVAYVDDPYSPADWSSGISALVASRSRREELGAMGRQRALQFSWARARDNFAARTRSQFG